MCAQRVCASECPPSETEAKLISLIQVGFVFTLYSAGLGSPFDNIILVQRTCLIKWTRLSNASPKTFNILKIEFSIVVLLNDSAEGRMMAHNRFSCRKMYIPLIMGEKMDYAIRNIKFIVLCAGIYFFGGGGGGEGWDMKNVAIPHQCQIFIWDRLSLICLWFFWKIIMVV